MIRFLKLGSIFLLILAVVGNVTVSLCQEETYDFSRARVLSINIKDSTIKVEHLRGLEHSFYTIKVPDTTVIKQGNANLKLSELKAGIKVSLAYSKDKEGNRIATSITVLPSD